jgi:peptide deformylase
MARQAKLFNGKLIEFEIRELVDFYDPILRKPTKPFDFTETPQREVEFYCYSMAMNLNEYPEGLGLSANQIGWDLRMCAINLGTHNAVFFNPEIVEASEPVSVYYEGCLSYPGLLLKIPRSEKIKIKFQAPAGNWLEETFEGLTAVCIQHEIDHLDGIVYTDKVSPITLDRAKRKVKSNIKKMNRFTELQKKRYDEISSEESAKNEQLLAGRAASSKDQVIQKPTVELPKPTIIGQIPDLKINFPTIAPQEQSKMLNPNAQKQFVYDGTKSQEYGGGFEIKGARG